MRLSLSDACSRHLDALASRHAGHHWIDWNYWFNLSPGGSLVDGLAGRNPPANVPRAPNPRTCGLAPDDARLVRARERFSIDRTLVKRPLARFRVYARDPGIAMHWVIALTLGVAVTPNPPRFAALLFIAGWVVYLIEEHLVHRFIFHSRPPRRQVLFDLYYRLHVGHHDQVAHSGLLFTPAWFAGPFVVSNGLLMWVLLRVIHQEPHAAAATALLGGLCAYLVFEYLHLQAHTRQGIAPPPRQSSKTAKTREDQ